jgi:hypothetical protein
MTCEIEKDREWVGQYECATHGVWYRDSDKKPKELCPVGEAEAEVARLNAHTWQQERAAVVKWLRGAGWMANPRDIETGEHWQEGGTNASK